MFGPKWLERLVIFGSETYRITLAKIKYGIISKGTYFKICFFCRNIYQFFSGNESILLVFSFAISFFEKLFLGWIRRRTEPSCVCVIDSDFEDQWTNFKILTFPKILCLTSEEKSTFREVLISILKWPSRENVKIWRLCLIVIWSKNSVFQFLLMNVFIFVINQHWNCN